MYSFDELPDTTRWVGMLAWRRSFELRESRRRFASLLWADAAGHRVIAHANGQVRWFTRAGLGGRRVGIHDPAEAGEIASFAADGLQGGTLRCASGRCYTWSAGNGALSHWVFRDELDRPLVELRVDSMGLEPAGPLTVHHERGGAADAALLATLGWYLAVQTLDDAALLVRAEAG